ncbi:potassium channel, subfamily K, member 7 [Megalops cyprinoides]|uniref:potassium channel, subfamily K, member 7 n=1 Tax=Megalops cyprinoides TaxID=118141 RepID=UPI00186493EA|nr:potassium channel, subfamily K, member 7 [Megalops cyprinoides]
MVPWLDCVRRFCRMRAFLILVLSYVLFLIFGAAVFMALEQPGEIAIQAGVQNLRVGFLNENRCVRESSLDNLLKKAFFAGKRGVAVLEAESEEYSYDFSSSLFFLTTFLTTTGYGSTMPMSDDGKLFLVMYSLLGIPITLLLLSCVTHHLLPWVTHGPVHHIQTRWGLSHQRAALVHAGLLLALTAVLFFLLPATTLCLLLPDWSFLESLYFCFISLSTIGLGDYLPGQTQSLETRQGLEFATSCYLLLGLVFLLVVLETFWELPQARALVRFFSGCREGQIKGLALDELILTADTPLTLKERAPPKEEPQYSLPISTISPSNPNEPQPSTTQSTSLPGP